MVLGTLLLGVLAVLLVWLVHWAAALPLLAVLVWLLAFFRDPPRVANLAPGEFCSPADGKVTEIARLDHHGQIGGPALRVGIFLSVFNVHANRSPCAGVVRGVQYTRGKFLDARNPDSGPENEANTLVIDPDAPLRGPVVVRQVAGLIARRIICHATDGDHLGAGERFGMIKFGSRTELIVPDDGAVQAVVKIGDKVNAGLTLLVRQDLEGSGAQSHAGDSEN